MYSCQWCGFRFSREAYPIKICPKCGCSLNHFTTIEAPLASDLIIKKTETPTNNVNVLDNKKNYSNTALTYHSWVNKDYSNTKEKDNSWIRYVLLYGLYILEFLITGSITLTSESSGESVTFTGIGAIIILCIPLIIIGIFKIYSLSSTQSKNK